MGSGASTLESGVDDAWKCTFERVKPSLAPMLSNGEVEAMEKLLGCGGNDNDDGLGTTGIADLWSSIAKSCDPWYDKSFEDIECALETEETESLSLDEFLSCSGDIGSNEAISVDASDSEGSLKFAGSTRLGNVVHIDMSNAQDVTFDQPGDNALPFLRSLSLSGCMFATATSAGSPALPFFASTCLMVLDLSYVQASFIETISFSFAARTLRKLSIEGCELEKLPENISTLEHLEHLVAGDNCIEDISGIEAPLRAISRTLKKLDLRENPVVDDSAAYLPLVNSLALVWRDGRGLSSDGVVAVRLDAVENLRDDMLNNDTVADINEDRGSCSCLEGNACESEYTCKDFRNRFAIAKRVRDENMHASVNVDALVGIKS